MSEIATVETWLHNVLSNDVTLSGLVGSRIYGYVAPNKATFPLVIFQFQGGRDVAGVGAARIMTSGVWLVKSVDRETNFTNLKAIEARIDSLLHKASGSVADGQVLACVREEPFSLVEVIDGIQYRHLGGMYRVLVQ